MQKKLQKEKAKVMHLLIKQRLKKHLLPNRQSKELRLRKAKERKRN